MAEQFDPRVTPARPDLAAALLEGKVEAARFAAGELRQAAAATAPLRRRPAPDAIQETQILFGETFTVYDEKDGWAWGQATLDGYVGYVQAERLAVPVIAPTHRVAAVRTFVFSRPDFKATPVMALSLNALVTETEGAERFVAIARGGFVFSDHLRRLDRRAADWVAEAERFVGAPYLWGGREGLGVDCSGLVQAALAAAGVAAPRDTDMMERGLGAPVTLSEGLVGLRRGDLVFWPGHMGVMLDAHRLLHANAHHMATVIEPLADAETRIRDLVGPISSIRRL
jgi:cell wall-associated NlpC family hydrolase